MKRFGSHTEQYIIAKRQNVVPKNTAKANKAGANLLRAYLSEKIWKVTLNLSVPSEWPKHFAIFTWIFAQKMGNCRKTLL
jgi:hypothetical protein